MIKHLWLDGGGTLFYEDEKYTAAHDKHRYRKYAELKGIKDLNKAEPEYLDLYKKYGSNSAVFSSLGMPSDYWMIALDEMDIDGIVTPDPQILKTLLSIKERIPVSLFTNWRPQQIEKLLKYLGIPKDTFTRVLSGDDIPVRKPALDGFYKMIEMSGLPAEQLMYVGDRVKVDINPAKELGIKTCFIWGEAPEADYSARDFSELEEIVLSLV